MPSVQASTSSPSGVSGGLVRHARRAAVAVAVIGLVALAGCADGAASAQPERKTTATQPVGAGESFKLPIGAEVYVPKSFKRGPRRADVLVHFHGASQVVRREVDLAGLQAVVVIVNYKGLSSAYEKPHAEPDRFSNLLDEALAALRERGVVRPEGRWRRICLSSFSAGYGAVRALLSRDDEYKRIDGIYLADSLYAGWKDEQPYSGADPADVAPFRRFAKDAAAGRKTLIISHSYFDPQKYAGTHVTADDLVAFVGATREQVDEAGPADMQIVSRAAKGQFEVWGCTAPAEEHGRHLQNMHYWLTRLPLDRARF